MLNNCCSAFCFVSIDRIRYPKSQPPSAISDRLLELSEDNRRTLWIPTGFAHGFVVLSEVAHFLYNLYNLYDARSERTILWNNPDLAIECPLDGQSSLSRKDADGIPFQNAEVCTDSLSESAS